MSMLRREEFCVSNSSTFHAACSLSTPPRGFLPPSVVVSPGDSSRLLSIPLFQRGLDKFSRIRIRRWIRVRGEASACLKKRKIKKIKRTSGRVSTIRWADLETAGVSLQNLREGGNSSRWCRTMLAMCEPGNFAKSCFPQGRKLCRSRAHPCLQIQARRHGCMSLFAGKRNIQCKSSDTAAAAAAEQFIVFWTQRRCCSSTEQSCESKRPTNEGSWEQENNAYPPANDGKGHMPVMFSGTTTGMIAHLSEQKPALREGQIVRRRLSSREALSVAVLYSTQRKELFLNGSLPLFFGKLCAMILSEPPAFR